MLDSRQSRAEDGESQFRSRASSSNTSRRTSALRSTNAGGWASPCPAWHWFASSMWRSSLRATAGWDITRCCSRWSSCRTSRRLGRGLSLPAIIASCVALPIFGRGRFGVQGRNAGCACLRRSALRRPRAAPFAAALRAGGRRLRSFALDPNGAAARLEDLHQTLSERQRPADSAQCGRCPSDSSALPRMFARCHGVRVIPSVVSALFGIGLNFEARTRVRPHKQRDCRAPAAVYRTAARAATRIPSTSGFRGQSRRARVRPTVTACRLCLSGSTW